MLGVILFGFYLMSAQGILALTLESDRSYISYVILALYILFSLHWLFLVSSLSKAQNAVDEAQPLLEAAAPGQLSSSDGSVGVGSTTLSKGLYSDYIGDLIKKARFGNEPVDQGVLLEALVERLMAKHAFGHFATDILLKFGLLGTIIGFIMMLSPVGSLTEFDPGILQSLLGQMSGGMAVALYTTAAGLVTSALLGLQYQILDSATARFVDKVAVSVDVLVLPLLALNKQVAVNKQSAETNLSMDTSTGDAQ